MDDITSSIINGSDPSTVKIRKKKSKNDSSRLLHRKSKKGMIGSKVIQKWRDPSSVDASYFALGLFMFAVFGGSVIKILNYFI